MKEKHQDKIWELAAAKVHNEANETEAKERGTIAQHAENRKIYDSVDEIHEKLSETIPLRHSSAYRSWKRVNQYFKRKKIRLYLNISKYAAIILLAFGVGTLINVHWKPPAPEAPPVYSEVHVPLGQMSEMTLPDGTHVWLNSGTTLRYANNFGDQSREVAMEGEAFFKVKHEEIPFKVKIKNREVEVLGTSFAAVAYPDEDFSQVTLVEGSVQVNDSKGQELKKIDPNQMLHLPDDLNQKIATYEVNTLFYESWINGEIKFDEEPLSDVARRMERWYNVEIRFTSEAARQIRFTGTVLKHKPIDQSIQAISLLLPIKVEHENNLEIKDVITISKKELPM